MEARDIIAKVSELQLTDEQEMEGKTIKGVIRPYIYEDELVIQFTDGTFIVLMGELRYVESSIVGIRDRPNFYITNTLGIISDEERDIVEKYKIKEAKKAQLANARRTVAMLEKEL